MNTNVLSSIWIYLFCFSSTKGLSLNQRGSRSKKYGKRSLNILCRTCWVKMSIHTFLFLVKFNLFTGACSVVFFAPVLIGACWWHLALVCWAWLSRHNLTFQSKTNPRAREWAGAGKKENAIFCTFWGNWRNGSNESTASYLRFTVQIGKTKTQNDRLSLTLNSPLSGNRIIGNSEVCKITFSLRRAKWL